MPSPGAADITVNWTALHQTMEGFGAADVWNATLSTGLADLFFSQTAGIGLSLLRTGIDPNGGTLSSWTNPKLAIARGAKVWAAPWSPSAADKTTGNTTTGSLMPSAYSAWAKTLASYVSAYQANVGSPLYALSVQNEPDYNTNGAYDMCLYGNSDMASFIDVLGPAIAGVSPTTKIMAPETSVWGNVWGFANAIMADPVADQYIGIYATHQYAGLSSYQPVDRSLWETEMSSFDGFNPGIGNGVGVAAWIHDAITSGNVTAWHYWWLIGDNADNEGLIGYSRNTTLTKRLYTMGNFSKFVRPGWVRVDTTGSKSGIYGVTAYKNPSTGEFAIVVINNYGSPITLSLALANATLGSSVTPYVTYDDSSGVMTIGSHGNLEQQSAIMTNGNGTFSVTVPYGVTTITGVAH
jgi:glucuronoarabinoxylan endo-1,4-beta-xylanase